MDASPNVDDAIEQAIQLQPGFNRQDGQSWSQIAWKMLEAQDWDRAIICFRESVRLDSNLVESWANLGSLYRRLGDLESSIDCFQQAVRRQPNNIGLVAATAAALRQAGHRDEAKLHCEAGLRLDPESAELHLLLGNILQEQDDFDAAIAYLEKAIRLAGRTEQNVSCLGIACFRQGEISRAVALFRESISLNPHFDDGHFHLGMALLLQGDYKQGWEEYEWRLGGRRRSISRSMIPLWNGRPLAANQTLLLAAEQGFGDTIQFVRFAADVKRRYGCQIVLQAQRPLISLLSTCQGIDRLIARDDALPSIDCYLPLASLPSVLHFNPLRSISKSSYLATAPDRATKWSSLLAPPKTAAGTRHMQVGLSWQGDPRFPADRCRSIPLVHFIPLLKTPNVDWISLQKGHGTDQLLSLDQTIKITNFGDQLDADGQAFLDTAAIMKQLDLVITSDTAVAHLAGALGIPVWIAVSHVPDWRWNLQGSDSVWYPTARLFRQPKLGDWTSVFSRMLDELRT